MARVKSPLDTWIVTLTGPQPPHLDFGNVAHRNSEDTAQSRLEMHLSPKTGDEMVQIYRRGSLLQVYSKLQILEARRSHAVRGRHSIFNLAFGPAQGCHVYRMQQAHAG